MRKHTYNGVWNRRNSALQRLEAQLKSGKKPLESARLQAGERVMQDLTPADVSRITNEISILKTKLK